MKKIILAIFLILGVVSFSAPEYIDVDKIQKNGYNISADKEDEFLVKKEIDENKKEKEDVFILYHFKQEAKEKSLLLRKTSPEGLKFTNSIETERGIIDKYVELNGTYVYILYAKKTKIKDCNILVLYTTDENFSKSELEKVCNKFLDEAESYLK